MNKYNVVMIEGKQCIPFLNLTEQEFYDKLWEWTYEDGLWDYLEENNLTEDILDQFIRENMFHECEDDDVDCFTFINNGDCIEEYQIDEGLFEFVHGKIKEYNDRQF